MRFGFVQDLIEEVTLCKFGGRPHWGKNFDRTFTHPRCPIRPRYGARFDEMLRVAAKYDPGGAFQPELFKKVCVCALACVCLNLRARVCV